MINLPIDNAFNLEVKARQAIIINALEDTQSLKALKNDKYLVIGSATNMIMNELFEGTIIKVSMDDIKQVSDGTLSVGAGLPWDKLIAYCLDNNFFGIENLTLIPGLVGAAPVQNIGAYGVEIKEVFIECSTIHLRSLKNKVFSAKDCQFGLSLIHI